MLLYLKNNHIYLPSNNVIVDDTVRFNVNITELNPSEYTFIANVNGDVIEFRDEFVLDKHHLKSKYLDISIIATHNKTGNRVVYTADTYPITNAVILGKPCTEWYPAIIKTLENRLSILEQYKLSSSKIIQEQSNNINSINNNINLIELAVKEINETGEIV